MTDNEITLKLDDRTYDVLSDLLSALSKRSSDEDGKTHVGRPKTGSEQSDEVYHDGGEVDVYPIKPCDVREREYIEKLKLYDVEIDDYRASNLLKHAINELELIREDEWMVKGYLKMVNYFSKMGHSGGSAEVFIMTLQALLRFEALSPLTNNPNEWSNVADGLWQSCRQSDAFSTDGGDSYYILDERLAGDGTNHAIYKTKPYTQND